MLPRKAPAAKLWSTRKVAATIVSCVDTVSGFVALDRTLSMKALSLAGSLSCMVPNRKGPLVNAKGPSMNGSKDQDLDGLLLTAVSARTSCGLSCTLDGYH